MRRDKTFARILLIFSIANVVRAAPALVRQRRLVADRAENGPAEEPEAAPESLAGSIHQNEVVPAAPPSVPGSEYGTPLESKQDSESGSSNVPVHQDRVVLPPLSEVVSAHQSPAGSENDGELWPSDGPVHQGLATYSYPHSGFGWSEQDFSLHSANLDFAPNSPSGFHQDSTPELPSGSSRFEYSPIWQVLHKDVVPVSTGKASQLLGRPSQWWQHTGSRPSTWEVGESSNSAGEPSQTVGELSQTAGESSHTVPEAHEMLPPALEAQPLQMLPPSPEAQPLHDEKTPWWHDLSLYADIDQDQSSDYGSMKSWASEVESKIPDETLLRERDHGHRFS